MTVLVDTSAFLALLAYDDSRHGEARETWHRLLEGQDELMTTNYTLLETVALAQARLGLAAVRAFHDDLLPVVGIEWIDEELHRDAMAALLTADRRRLSLVDCASFAVMRRRGVERAFTYDADFAAQGFLPA